MKGGVGKHFGIFDGIGKKVVNRGVNGQRVSCFFLSLYLKDSTNANKMEPRVTEGWTSQRVTGQMIL